MMNKQKYPRRHFFYRISFSVLNALLFLPSAEAWANCTKSRNVPNPKNDLSRLQKLYSRKESCIWIFTGDSITHGAKHTNGYRSYPEIFAERVRWEMRRFRDIVINTAISGNTTVDILNDFDWRVKRFAPSVVSLMIGTNDCCNNRVSLDDFRHNLNLLLDNIIELGAIPILHTPNIIDAEHATTRATLKYYVQEIQNIAKQRDILLIDHWSFWNEKPKREVLAKWMNDPIHPNENGHIEMAHLLFREMKIFDPLSPVCKENKL